MTFALRTLALAALSALAFSASAMTSIDDEALSAVSGQDGVTIAGDLNINIGSFKYTDTDANGGSVSFNNIGVTGMFVMTIDILNAATTESAVATSMAKYVGAAAPTEAAKLVTSGIYDGATDVVQFAFPDGGLDHKLAPSVTVASITMGNSTKSFGSIALNNIDMQGSKFWIYAH
ncbi:DUF6160 family protein [Ideonella azotifigens]|uniref:DUF6160 domain-containing protein n=1 Tax=Ideonella azotifigens TaxID=513160 RepID=A0ABN1K9Z6_9BURK|nr:DUF6160 family protein [Ideonella azotifigens]MCD2338948.1 DUF6160 family protein [Ideonella azotifigens]